MELQFFKLITLLFLTPIDRMYHDVIHRIVKTNRKRSICSILFYVLAIVVFVCLIHADYQTLGVVLENLDHMTAELNLYLLVFIFQCGYILIFISSIIKHMIYILAPKLYQQPKELDWYITALIMVFVLWISVFFIAQLAHVLAKV